MRCLSGLTAPANELACGFLASSLSCVSWPQAAKVCHVSLLAARLPCNRTHCLLLSPFFHQIQLCLGKLGQRQRASSGQEDKKVARRIGTTPTNSSPFAGPVRPVSRKGKRCGAGVYPAANRLLRCFVYWLTARIVALHSYYWRSYHPLTRASDTLPLGVITTRCLHHHPFEQTAITTPSPRPWLWPIQPCRKSTW